MSTEAIQPAMARGCTSATQAWRAKKEPQPSEDEAIGCTWGSSAGHFGESIILGFLHKKTGASRSWCLIQPWRLSAGLITAENMQ